uniref:Uncharacterized protein n=1 Tax=Oryza punctata TaxID=4537 RepID=A0A0E0LM38_ORYPU
MASARGDGKRRRGRRMAAVAACMRTSGNAPHRALCEVESSLHQIQIPIAASILASRMATAPACPSSRRDQGGAGWASHTAPRLRCFINIGGDIGPHLNTASGEELLHADCAVSIAFGCRSSEPGLARV